MLECARVQRDRAGLLAAGERDAAVQPPECRQLGVGDLLAQVSGARPRRRRLDEIVLEQPRLGQRGPDRELVFPGETAGAEQRSEQLRRLAAAAALERRGASRERRVQNGLGHRGEYTEAL